jgi:mannan polymerase II complex MNN10 subunit
MRNLGANGYPSFSTQNQGFFTRHMRRISSSLPRFNAHSDSPYAKHEKAKRGSWPGQNVPLVGRILSLVNRMGRKLKIRLLIALILLLCVTIFYNTRE